MKISVTRDGVLRWREGRKAVFSCRLLPCDRGYALPAHYYVMQEAPLSLTPVGELRVTRAGADFVLIKEFPGFVLRQTVRPTADGCVLQTALQVTGAGPIPRTFNLLSFPGRQFSADARALVFFSGRWMKRAAEIEEGMHGNLIFAVQDGDRAVTIAADPTTACPLLYGYLRMTWQGMVTLPPEPAGLLDLGQVEITLGSDAQGQLETFARRYDAPAPLKPAPTGWNSWDFYHSSISQDAISDNARVLAQSALHDRLRWCILDMGWETRFGEWEADPHFPDGMAAMAQAIRAQGLEPGIWLAPIIIDPECNFMQEDYRWVGMNRFGFPDLTYECCGLFGYILDVTRPEGERWLFDLFRRFREMGYSYFKLDFLRFLMYVDHFHDRSLTPVQVMRKALSIVRRAVGDEAYIMGCNLPFEVGPGYVDGARVSGDVAVFWENIRNNARAIAATYFFNGRWWHNDPDFLVARGRDTYTGSRPIYTTWWFPRQDQLAADEETLQAYRRIHDLSCTLSLEEARTHASLEILLGGALILGDPLMYLNEAGQALLQKALSAETVPGRPLRLFSDDDPPSIWVQRLSGSARIGFFNWTDNARTVSVSLAEAGIAGAGAIVDFWHGDPVTATDGMLSAELLPHECRVFDITLPDRI